MITRYTRTKAVQINSKLSAVLDFLRWISALFVVIGHVRAMVFPPYDEYINPNIVVNFFYLLTGFGHQAVMIFFVLSGFLVGGSVLEKVDINQFNLRNYLIDRISRLYPVYFVCLFFGGFLDWCGVENFLVSGLYTVSEKNTIGIIGYDAQSRLTGGILVINLFMLQGLLGPTFGTNGPLWSIAMEFWYYLLFPLTLLPLYNKKLDHRAFYFFLLILILLLLGLNSEFFVLFLCGCLVFLLEK